MTNDTSYIDSIQRIERMVQEWEQTQEPGNSHVLLMNVSSRLARVEFNTVIDLLIGWALRLNGHKVNHYSCTSGLPQCHLGIKRSVHHSLPPCDECVSVSDKIYSTKQVGWNAWPDAYDAQLRDWLAELEEMPLAELLEVRREGLPLGKLVAPSVRWALRIGELNLNDQSSWYIARAIVGAAQLARDFRSFIRENSLEAVVLFNGLSYPEAVVKSISQENGIRVVTYETGLKPGTTFFSSEEATRYFVEVPEGFELTEAENAEFDTYLAGRFKGDFEVGGIKFWPEMHGISPELQRKIDKSGALVPVFTNVVFDTSQHWSNTTFTSMFSWLESTLAFAKEFPETLFVVRAHPDETRVGKESVESVERWLKTSGYLELDNVEFIDPDNYTSSYELISQAKFCLVYNSSVGLEAAVLGKLTLCGGKPRYLNSDAVEYQDAEVEYLRLLKVYLEADALEFDAQRCELARKYLYYSHHHACMNTAQFVSINEGRRELAIDNLEALRLENSKELAIIVKGILKGNAFVYPIQARG